MRIITVGREFGSGGRELGKRLADELSMNYYDREILTALAGKLKMDESYISEKVDRGLLSAIPVSFGRTFSYRQQDTVKILAEQQNIIREIAKKGEDFVIVGRNADVILAQYHPFRIFVYADMESKLNRCKEREELEDLAKRIRQVDKGIVYIDDTAVSQPQHHHGKGCLSSFDGILLVQHPVGECLQILSAVGTGEKVQHQY